MNWLVAIGFWCLTAFFFLIVFSACARAGRRMDDLADRALLTREERDEQQATVVLFPTTGRRVMGVHYDTGRGSSRPGA